MYATNTVDVSSKTSNYGKSGSCMDIGESKIVVTARRSLGYKKTVFVVSERTL